MFDFNKKICKKYILAPSCKEIYLPFSSGILQSLKDEGIICGGVSFLKDYYKIIRPEPQCNHLIFTLKGKGKLYLPSGEFDLLPGTLYVGHKGIPHCYALDGEYWEIAWLNVASLPNELDAMINLSPAVRKSESGMKIKELIEAANEECVKSDQYLHSAMTSIGQFLLIILWREFSIKKLETDNEKIKFQILENKISREVNRKWNIKALIKESKIFYTPVHFNRLCKKNWGMSAMKKVTFIRMTEAKKLLLSTDYPVRVISERLGYTNAYAFSTAFKKNLGISPRTMRNQKD